MGSASRLIRRGSPRLILIAGLAGLCGFALLAISLSDRGGAAYPGTNGKIAFSYGATYESTGIYTANADGSSATKLTSGPYDFAPSFSANGAKIAFNRDRGLVVMNADGTGQVQISTGAHAENTTTTWQSNYKDGAETIPEVKIQSRTTSGYGYYDPIFTPDGSQLVVAESVDNSVETSICAVEKAKDEDCIDYSDPGAYFDYDYECGECHEHLVTVNSTTGALISQVTPKTTNVNDFDQTVAADGKIAFRRGTSSSATSGIFVINSPGAAPVQLTSGYGDRSPDFSPDGTKIVFDRGGNEFGVMASTGGAVTLVTPPPAPAGGYASSYSPAFSPDGTQLIFNRFVGGPKITSERGLYTMPATGGAVVRVAEGQDPAWQPIPIPPPVVKSTFKGKKGKVKLDKKHKAVIGTVTCGSSPCSLKVALAKLKAGKAKCGAKVKTPKTLLPGASAKVSASVKGKCLTKLVTAGKGVLTVKITITSATGTETLTFKVTLVPGGKKGKKGGKGGKGGK